MNTYEVEEYNVVRKESLPVTLVVKYISSIQIVFASIINKYSILFIMTNGKTFYKYFNEKEEAEKEYNVLRKMISSYHTDPL